MEIYGREMATDYFKGVNSTFDAELQVPTLGFCFG